jgi:hypothetical protein
MEEGEATRPPPAGRPAGRPRPAPPSLASVEAPRALEVRLRLEGVLLVQTLCLGATMWIATWLSASILALLVFTPVPPYSHPSSAQDTVDTLLKEYGIEGLTNQQREGLTRLIGASRQSHLADSAMRFVEDQGYKALKLSLVSADGVRWLVVHGRLGKYATKDLPFSFPEFTFRDGTYYCKEELLSGIKEMIGPDGRTHRFQFATWKELR